MMMVAFLLTQNCLCKNIKLNTIYNIYIINHA